MSSLGSCFAKFLLSLVILGQLLIFSVRCNPLTEENPLVTGESHAASDNVILEDALTLQVDEQLPPDPVESPMSSNGPETQDPQDDNNETFVPPPPPDEGTPPPISDPSQCLVSVEIAECGPLLQGLGSNVRPDCPCHNFCGNSYLGCCDFASDCPLDCEPLLGEKFVAGCVLSPSISLPPSGGDLSPPPATNAPDDTSRPTSATPPPAPSESSNECLVTSNEEECSALLQKAGPRDDGCMCRNFCNGDEIDCCQLGQECPPLECSGDFVAGCMDMDEQTISPQPSPAPTPAPKCYVTVNTQSCHQVSSTQTPDENCDCYNYCDGEYIGCSKYDVFESIQCEGEVVAGCELDPDPKCLVSVNTGECEPLMEGVVDDLPDSDRICDCFDFCGDNYVGCCGFNEFCGFKCAGPVSVTGCTIDDVPARSRRKLESNTQEMEIPVGGFYSPDIWPSGFYPDGAAAAPSG